MKYTKITVPTEGERITTCEGKLSVPDHPILLWIEGDGIGPDIMTASKRIGTRAVRPSTADSARFPGWRSMPGRRRPACTAATTSRPRA